MIDLPPDLYKRLAEDARKAGQAPEALSRASLAAALQERNVSQPRTARDVLQAADRVQPLSDALRGRIIPGVTLEEVCTALIYAAGPSLSDIINEQRGPYQ